MKLLKQREKAEFDASLVKCELNKPDTNVENSLHHSFKTPNKTVVDSHFEKPFQERLNLTPFTNKFLPGNNDSEMNFHTDKNKTNTSNKHEFNSNHKDALKKEPIDSFIEKLVEYQKTTLPSDNMHLSAQEVLQREFESRNLPTMELRRFNGNPAHWPQFIENFYNRI